MLLALLATLAGAGPQLSTWSIILTQNDQSIAPLTNELVDKLKQRVGTRLGTLDEHIQRWRSLPKDARLKECEDLPCLGALAKETQVDRVLWIDALVTEK